MDFVNELRKEFPVTSLCTYFDIAYDCGGASFSKAACERYFNDWAKSASLNERGGPGRARLFQESDELREYINTLIHGSGASHIAFTKNTNEGINAILQSFNFHEGDNIVTDVMEHASVIMPSLNMTRKNVEVKMAMDCEDGKVKIEELQSLCDEHTRMILVSYQQSATGTLLDLSILGPWCKKHHIFLVVDAIQSIGIIPFEVEKWNVSAVSCGSYKGLLGGFCVAFTYYNEELLKEMWPCYIAAGFYNTIDRTNNTLVCKDETQARKMEDSTIDFMGLYVLHDSVKRILEIGQENITAHIFALYDLLLDGVISLGYNTVLKKGEEHSNCVTLRCDKEVFDYLRSKNICLSYNSNKYLRISIAPYNTKEDVNYLLECLKNK